MVKKGRLRGMVMFLMTSITSPCCTPLIVPIILALLAGTPAAVWLTQHLGWVYGGLTLVSAVSLGLGLHWMRQQSPSPHTTPFRQEPVPQTIHETHSQLITEL